MTTNRYEPQQPGLKHVAHKLRGTDVGEPLLGHLIQLLASSKEKLVVEAVAHFVNREVTREIPGSLIEPRSAALKSRLVDPDYPYFVRRACARLYAGVPIVFTSV